MVKRTRDGVHMQERLARLWSTKRVSARLWSQGLFVVHDGGTDYKGVVLARLWDQLAMIRVIFQRLSNMSDKA
jgi:hypothetical protein